MSALEIAVEALEWIVANVWPRIKAHQVARAALASIGAARKKASNIERRDMSIIEPRDDDECDCCGLQRTKVAYFGGVDARLCFTCLADGLDEVTVPTGDVP